MKYILTIKDMRCKTYESLIKQNLLSVGNEDYKIIKKGV